MRCCIFNLVKKIPTTNIEKVLINNWTNVIELKMSFLVVKM